MPTLLNVKLFTSLLALMLSFDLQASEAADYHFLKGFLHKGGSARIEITEKSSAKYLAKMSYEIKKRALVPIPKKVLSGEKIIELPPEFKDELGYKKLSKKRIIETPSARLEFIKKMEWKGRSDAYDLFIIPHNGKSKIEVIYHPSLPAAGWGKVVITFISPYPVLNGYSAIIEMN